MTMRVEGRYSIGDRGAVYEFKVKLSMRLRGVKISDNELQDETSYAVEVFATGLRQKYKWVGPVYLTGRSGGWLAVEDKLGEATEDELGDIDEQVKEAKKDFETAIIDTFGYEENGRRAHARNGVQQRLPGPGFVDPKLKKAYEFFREHAGGIVGQSAKGAMDLARAEKYADDHGWEAVWEDDPEEYELGDAETERPFEVLMCTLKDENGRVLGSLGSIGMSGNTRQDRDYGRVVEAELALEAMP